jgi:superkiller protein 3
MAGQRSELSSMSTKSALKAARIALDSRDFEDAAEKAKVVVKQEPQNYHAYVKTKLANST